MAEPTTEPTTPTPPAAPPPAPPPVAAAPVAPQKKGKGDRDTINIPRPEFMARVRREAAKEAATLAEKLVQERLGVSLDKAKELIAAGGQPAAAGAPAQSNAAVRRYEQEQQKLNAEIAALKSKNQKLEVKNKKTYERMKDRLTDEQLRRHAFASGAKDEDAADFLLQLYAKRVRAAIGKGETPPAAPAYFAEARKSNAYLFGTGAPPPPPVVVAPSTAPPESRAPGEVTPTPSPPGAPPAEKSVDNMSAAEFSQHAARYGYRPGM